MLVQFSKNWWLMAINGAIAILFGIFALFVPEGTIIVIAKYFGIVVLIGGLIILVGAIRNIKIKQSYALMMTEAIISIAIGIIILVFTKETIEIFMILIGLWAVIVGITLLVLLANIKEGTHDKYVILFSGVLSVIFGVVVLFNPFTMAAVLTIIVGIAALILGLFMIYIAFRVKKLNETP